MQFKEGLTEASGKRRRRLGNTALCTCKFCSETGKEVILSLFGRKDGHGRQHSECVCRKEDDVLCGGSCGNRAHDVLDVIDRIRNTGVFGHALVCEIDLAVFVESDVFKQSVALDCVVDVGFGILVEIDDLCIATALEVEHSVVVPAVLVVTDEKTFGIG